MDGKKKTVTLNIDDTDSNTRRILSAISSSVVKGKKIVVLTGAGISCSSGIPVSMLYLGGESDVNYFIRTFAHQTVYMPLSRGNTQGLFYAVAISSTRICFVNQPPPVPSTHLSHNLSVPSIPRPQPQPTGLLKCLTLRRSCYVHIRRT